MPINAINNVFYVSYFSVKYNGSTIEDLINEGRTTTY